MASKILPEGLVDLKIHSEYNGDVRCLLVEASMSDIYSMTYVEFCSSHGEVSSYAGFVFWTWRMNI